MIIIELHETPVKWTLDFEGLNLVVFKLLGTMPKIRIVETLRQLEFTTDDSRLTRNERLETYDR